MAHDDATEHTSAFQSPFLNRRPAMQDVSRSSSSSSMSSGSYNVDSSPPSSPILPPAEDVMDDDDNNNNATQGLSLGDGRGVSRLYTSFLDPSRDARIRSPEQGSRSIQHSPVHPFAGSTFSTASQRMYSSPPLYEKGGERARFKRRNPKLDVHDEDAQEFISRSQLKSLVQNNLAQADDKNKSEAAEASALHRDNVIWEEAINECIVTTDTTIDLSNLSLTTVSPKVSDLNNLVVLDKTAPPQAQAQVPISRSSSYFTRALSRSTTSGVFGAASLGSHPGEIRMFLMNNNITSLPKEIFKLDSLIALSLRSNQLKELPPLISELRNLRELNIANNQLHFLPSEILRLQLSSLFVEMNPFIQPQPSPNQLTFPLIGTNKKLRSVMPLTELAMRVLLQPSATALTSPASHPRCETLLEDLYDTPLDVNYSLPPGLKTILSSCAPGSISVPVSSIVSPPSPIAYSQEPSSSLTSPTFCSVSTCPSKRHLFYNEARYQKPVFIQHAEERLTWEREIAGLKVGGEHGVPVLWRGCSAGCLDEMDGDPGQEPSAADDGGDWEMDTDDNPPVAYVGVTDEAPATSGGSQPAPFSSEGFDFDD